MAKFRTFSQISFCELAVGKTEVRPELSFFCFCAGALSCWNFYHVSRVISFNWYGDWLNPKNLLFVCFSSKSVFAFTYLMQIFTVNTYRKYLCYLFKIFVFNMRTYFYKLMREQKQCFFYVTRHLFQIFNTVFITNVYFKYISHFSTGNFSLWIF